MADLISRNLEGNGGMIENNPDASLLDLLTAKRKQMQAKAFQSQNQENLPAHKRSDYSVARSSYGPDGDTQGNLMQVETEINKQNPGNENTLFDRSGQVDDDGQAIDSSSTAARKYFDNMKLSASKGLGDFVGGWGSIFQVVEAGIGTAADMVNPNKMDFDGNILNQAFKNFGANLEDNNVLSQMMQEYGKNRSEADSNFRPEEVENPTLSAASFLNPEMWSTHGGEFLPQLTEILATIGASALVKKGVQLGAKKALTEVLKENAERIAVKAVTKDATIEGVKSGLKAGAQSNKSWFAKNILGETAVSTTGRYTGSAATNSVRGSGSGILGQTMTSEGLLTKGFGDVVQGVAGGTITNLTVSLRNAGENFNTYSKVYQKDENGNVLLDQEGKPVRVFDDAQLGELAADTFGVNMQYLGADILSWGMTFGKGWQHLGSFGSKLTSNIGKKAIAETSAGIMSKMTAPVAKNLMKLGGKMAFEGLEETIQESYEEWSKMKAYHEMHGSMEGYQGRVTENYDFEKGIGGPTGGFWDYYKSKDSEAVRAISFGLGAIAGGTFNISTLWDKHANDVYKLQSRSENLKKIFEKGTEGKAYQDKFVKDTMAELIMENKGGAFQDFLQTLYNEDKVTDEDIVKYATIYENLSDNYNKIKSLNIAGKKAYMMHTSKEFDLREAAQQATEIYQTNKEKIDEQFETLDDDQKTDKMRAEFDKKIKKEEQIYKSKIVPIGNMLTKIKASKINLMIDKKADMVDYDLDVQYDENGEANINYVERKLNQNNVDDSLNPETDENEDVTIEPEDQDEFDTFEKQLRNGFKGVKEKGKAAINWVTRMMGIANNEEVDTDQEVDEEGNPIEQVVDGAIQTLADTFETTIDIDNEIDKNQEMMDTLLQEQEDETAKQTEEFEIARETENMAVEEDSTLDDKQKAEKKAEIKQRFDDEIKNAEFNINQDRLKKSDPFSRQNINLEKAKKLKIKSKKVADAQAQKDAEPKDEFVSDKIIPTDKPYGIDNRDRAQFKKKGTIGSHVIPYIAGMINQEEKLSKSDQAIYNAFKQDIDTTAEQELGLMTQALSEESLDKDSREFVLNTLVSKRKKQLSSKEGISNPDAKPELDLEEDWVRDGRAKKGDLDAIANKLKSAYRKISATDKNIGFIGKAARAIKNVVIDRRDADFGNNEFLMDSQARQISYALQEMYPGQNINVFAVEDMKRTVGMEAFGYTLASQIYIDERLWNQDDVLMHEMAHIYYALNKEEPIVRTMLNYAVQNKALVAKVLADYDQEIQYRLTKKDENGNDIDIAKVDILGDLLYQQMSPEAKVDFFKKMIDEGVMTEIPFQEQEIIADELFAAALEGPLSEKYDKFFNEKIEEEPKRRYMAKKFWGKVKEKGERFSDKGQRKVFFESLSSGDQQIYSDNLKSLMEGFVAKKQSNDISTAGRASTTRNLNQNISSRLDSIDDDIRAERDQLLNGLLRTQFMKDNNINVEDLIDTVAFDQIFNVDRLQYSNQIGNVVKGFTAKYNKGVSISNKLRGAKWKNLKYANPERLRYHLIKTARESHSGPDFIRRLQETEYDEVEKFMTWVGKDRDDGNLMLNTLWWHENNMSDITSFRTYINPTGSTSLEVNLNNREMAVAENVLDKITKPFVPKEREASADTQIAYDNLIKASRKIVNGDFTNADLFSVFKALTTDEMDVVGMWEANRININGKVMPLNTAIYNFVTNKSGNGLLGNYGRTKTRNGQAEFGLLDAKGKNKPAVRTFIRSIINENRKFTSSMTTVHADGNQHPSRIVDNYLTRNFKQMKDDANRTMKTKEQFYARYGRVNKEGAGARSNVLLDFLYDKFKKGQNVDLVEFGGIENDFNEDKSVTLKENDAASDRLNQFVVYLKSANKKSYLMDTGRYSDSSRAYFMEVPKTETDQLLTFKDKKMVFKNKAALTNVYNTHASLGYTGSLTDFRNLIEESIRDTSDFLESNLSVLGADESVNNPISKMFDIKGKLTADAKMKVANFELNNILNGTNFTEIMFPSFRMNVDGENELVKRAKSGLSPMFSFKNMQVENIYVNDVMVNEGTSGEYTATDSGFYILEKHANRFRAAGGTMMPLGNAFKFLQTGVENNNPNWKGQNIYNKGFGTVLNDEVVAKNPQLKGVYELLKRRDQKYTDTMGRPDSDNILDGSNHHLPMIVTKSSNKNKLSGIPAGYDMNVMDIDMINDMTNLGNVAAIDEILDKHYYDGEDFMGLSGENFGIQQVMDIDKNEVNSPIQFLKSVTTNMMFSGNRDEILSVLTDIHKLSQAQIQQGYDMIMSGNVNETKEFFKTLIDEDKVDQTQKDVLLIDDLSLKTPYLRELVKNTFANYVKKNGLKLKTPGGILREKPTLVQKQFKTSSDLNATSGNKGLSFYQQRADGSYTSGEVVIPNRMLDGSKKKNPIKAREYFTTETPTQENLESSLRAAKLEAKKRGTNVGKVFNDNDEHVGFYAAGSAVMATRIPSHGQQSTGFFEVVDFTGEDGNNIQLPNDWKRIVGSDNDGDQVFVQHKGMRTGEWNSIFDKLQNHYMNPRTQKEINEGIDFQDEAKAAVNYSENIYGKRDDAFVLPFSSRGREIAFKDTLISKGNVGIAADLHTTLRMLASYGVELKKGIEIDGVELNRFIDSESESITIKSAKLFNIILDNSKYGFADKLGINTNTIQAAMVLTNLGFELDQVAAVLNHPVMVEYARLKNRNSGIFNRDEKGNIFQNMINNPKLKLIGRSNDSIVIDTKNPTANNQPIFDLIRFVDNMTSNELQHVGSVLSTHNTMSVNPIEINEMMNNFNQTLNNESNKNLTFPEDFKENPIVRNYIDTLMKNKSIQEEMDPSFSPGIEEVYKNITESTGKNLSKAEHKKLSSALNYFHASQLLGLNNLDKKQFTELTQKDHPRNVFNRLLAYKEDLRKTIVDEDFDNPMNSRTALDESLLFSKGLNFSHAGNVKYISINSNFHQDMIDEELREQMINEFNEIPIELRNDLLLYDLSKNGWAGPQSLFPLFSKAVKQNISKNANIPMNNSSNQLDVLRNRLIRNNPKMFSMYDKVFNFDKDGNLSINPDLSIKSANLLGSIESGKPTIFRTQDKDGKIRLVKFTGFNVDEIGQNINEKSKVGTFDYYNYLLDKAKSKMFIDYQAPSSDPKIDYITVPHINNDLDDDGTYDQLKEIENRLRNGQIEVQERGRAMLSDWYNYDRKLTQEEHNKVMEYPQGFEQNRKVENFKRYNDEYAVAQSLKPYINDETIKKMSDKQLNDIFASDQSLNKIVSGVPDTGKAIGLRDKFAYAEVLLPVVLELAQRGAIAQSAMLDKAAAKHNVKLRPLGKDISLIDKWALSNNISSAHPGVQAAVAKMESEYKTFLKEKSNYVKKINNATDALYKEKFNYKISDRGIVDTVKHLYNQLFTNKEDFYNTLYGSLVVKENLTNGENGKVITNIRYKTEEEIQAGLKDGSISTAQHNFYKATKEMTDEQIKYTGAEVRQGYIPHTAPNMMEAFSRRGLLGVLVNAKTLDEKIYDVVMDAKNPITGELVKGVSFKEIEDWYSALSKGKRDFNDSSDFTKLKYKAIGLQRKGQNQDGSPIRYSNIEMGTAFGDVFMDRFSKGRSVKSTDFPSMDLNKAFNDYIHSALFVHGNDKFQGFKRMLPMIDGILAQLDRDENPNMSAYVEKIWKNYFLKGAKQHNLKNTAALESIGISSDKVIDYLTKGSLVYWLGFKGLAIGGGAYAIGNVLVGKYKNIVNDGGTAWGKGEKRFWLGKDGKFDVRDPFKGIREANEILKNTGFMDINIFDDISVEEKSGIEKTLMELALLPMAKSERWIQGVQFLGNLEDQEWEQLRQGEALDGNRMNQLEDRVKLAQGKGYQPTDQRMIQMYSWGRMMMQFSRWIPTNLYDKFGKEDIDRNGQYYIGSYNKVYKTIQKAIDGRWSYSQFQEYRKSLEPEDRRRLDAGLMGMGLTSLIVGVNTFANIGPLGKVASDEHIFADWDRLSYKMIPPAVSMLTN